MPAHTSGALPDEVHSVRSDVAPAPPVSATTSGTIAIDRSGLTHTTSSRRRLNSLKLHQRRNTEKTVIPMQTEMWVMTARDFIELSRLERHQTMREQEKLIRWDASMRHIFFVSHQWTSFDHPDHTQQQLRTFQSLLRRMMNGTCPETTPSLADAGLPASRWVLRQPAPRAHRAGGRDWNINW